MFSVGNFWISEQKYVLKAYDESFFQFIYPNLCID